MHPLNYKTNVNICFFYKGASFRDYRGPIQKGVSWGEYSALPMIPWGDKVIVEWPQAYKAFDFVFASRGNR